MDGKKCFKCGKVGHMKRDCPEKANASMQGTKCFLHVEGTAIFREIALNMATGNRADTSPGQSKNSAAGNRQMEVPFPESKSMFIDTHCHLEYIFEKNRHTGSFSEFKQRFPFPANFEGCITTFCDPAAFSSFGTWRDVLSEEGVWGTFGCHPHNAKYYNDDLEAKIIQCLEHPKAVALGEVGLDYSSHSGSPLRFKKKCLPNKLLGCDVRETFGCSLPRRRS
ncbi:Putative deoxyribonuclease tatdn2 [Desmophyllum pertusum]|uniref:Deoxyribonuclease tatdn2 n=1 Tax=Desmophyllum pertusum TaxID=174260 RepID=A0A9W9ZA87_9CNID|nr:Putative deoxyribonuclease tatdn2 [Desmophyllum pertusum]